MAGVARNTDTISGTTGGSYCSYSYPVSCCCDEYGCGSYTQTDYASASITGTVTGGSTTVFVNGLGLSFIGSRTVENADCSSPYSGDSSGNGAVSSGGTHNVFVSGLAVSDNGSNVTTHTGNTGTIGSGSENVFIAD